jgi:cysteine synthase A
MNVSGSTLQAIGGTPLVRLRRVIPPGCARILVKYEGLNPTGSMKDRMAQAMIERAEEDGRLRAGSSVVEYTGAALALVCAAKGYRLSIVTSDAFSEDKLAQMAALGAELTVLPADGRLITRELIERMIRAAAGIAERSGTYWTDQLGNADSITGYYPMGEEIWEQSGGQVSAFVQSVGTAASLSGVATVLRKHSPAPDYRILTSGRSPLASFLPYAGRWNRPRATARPRRPGPGFMSQPDRPARSKQSCRRYAGSNVPIPC